MATQHSNPGYKPIKLLTNAFEITQLPIKKYSMYDVFNPACPIRNKRVQLMHHLQVTVAPDVFNPRILYDGQAIVYAPRELPLANNGSGTFNVRLGDRGAADPSAKGTFQIRFTLTIGGQIDARHLYDLIHDKRNTNRALVATNLIQLIVRQGPNMHNTNNGRAYFTGEDKKVLSGSGLELWRGTFQSVRPTMGKMILNVDTCTAAVYQSGPLIQICMQKIRGRDARDLNLRERDMNFKTLEKFLKGLRMKVKTGGGKSRTQTIRGLVAAAGEFTFLKDDSVEMTVAGYFQQIHNIRIQYPRIIGVRLTSSKNPRQDVVPLELCEIEHGQLFKRKIPEELTSDMVKFSTMKPHIRLEKILAAAQLSGRSEFVIESGMTLDINPMGVDAKLLHVPRLFFQGNTPLPVRDGAWNVVRQRFTHPATLDYWMVISFVNDFNLQKLTQLMIASGASLLNSCNNLGMRINPQPFMLPNANPHDVDKVLLESAQKYSRQVGLADSEAAVGDFLSKLMVIVILPNNGAGIRSAVKHWGDIKQGVATQCLRENKLGRPNDQYWNNIALKLNARLGGTNFFSTSPTFDQLTKEPFMIMGVDVGHPGPSVQKPSVTGIVYSHDQFATKYVALTAIQPPRMEQILDLKKYVFRAINSFAARNNGPPRRLIFYRDGISEGEFDKVAKLEIEEIKEALARVWEMNKEVLQKTPFPPLTYIVVGKRHHAVFFPRQGEGDKTGNAFAGSLIDSGVTHPAVRDFYLQSHAAIQGTCRSSHYTILHDENWNYDMRMMQELSYTLCHNYAKATRSVSIPAPVYYADLVCSRGMFHIDPNNRELGFDDSATTSSGSSSQTLDMDSWLRAFGHVHPRLSKSMYFL